MKAALQNLNALEMTALSCVAMALVYALSGVLGLLLGWVLERFFYSPLYHISERRSASQHHPAFVRRGNTWFKAPPLQDAPVVFCGLQNTYCRSPRVVELWTLTADIPGHPRGSTVSRETLELAGYWVPIAPAPQLPFPKET